MQQRFLLQILLLAQHVSCTTMPIIRSSRVLYSGGEIKGLQFRIMEICLYQSCAEFLPSCEILPVSHTTRQHVPVTVHLRVY